MGSRRLAAGGDRRPAMLLRYWQTPTARPSVRAPSSSGSLLRISRLAYLPPLLEEVMTRFSLLVFLFALAMPLRPGDAAELWQTRPPTPAPVSGGHSGYADVNGIRLFHIEIGSGPPVVLLHGGLANSDYFGIQARALARAHRVILVDSRGHGRSTRDQRPFGYDLMADDVAALLDTLKIDKATIVGWSDGG